MTSSRDLAVVFNEGVASLSVSQITVYDAAGNVIPIAQVTTTDPYREVWDVTLLNAVDEYPNQGSVVIAAGVQASNGATLSDATTLSFRWSRRPSVVHTPTQAGAPRDLVAVGGMS